MESVESRGKKEEIKILDSMDTEEKRKLYYRIERSKNNSARESYEELVAEIANEKDWSLDLLEKVYENLKTEFDNENSADSTKSNISKAS